MLNISKESLAPKLFESRRESHRQHAQGRVHELVYCMLLCEAAGKAATIEDIAGQAVVTYPQYFYTWVNDDHVPDLAVLMLNLEQAVNEGLVKGCWHDGWKLTRRGRNVAADIDRRRKIVRINH